MFCVFTEVLVCKMIRLLSNKTMLLPMSKVDKSLLLIHEVPPLQ